MAFPSPLAPEQQDVFTCINPVCRFAELPELSCIQLRHRRKSYSPGVSRPATGLLYSSGAAFRFHAATQFFITASADSVTGSPSASARFPRRMPFRANACSGAVFRRAAFQVMDMCSLQTSPFPRQLLIHCSGYAERTPTGGSSFPFIPGNRIKPVQIQFHGIFSICSIPRATTEISSYPQPVSVRVPSVCQPFPGSRVVCTRRRHSFAIHHPAGCRFSVSWQNAAPGFAGLSITCRKSIRRARVLPFSGLTRGQFMTSLLPT